MKKENFKIQRLFLGIPLPSFLQKELFDCIAPFYHLPSVRWVPKENYHITLQFIGDATQEQTENIAQKLNHFQKDHTSFDLFLKQFSFFPKRKPYMIWAVAHAHAPFFHLSTDLHHCLNLPGSPPKNSIPHITIGRFKDPQTVRHITLPSLRQPIPLHVDQIILWESVLSHSGARYFPLHSFRLEG